MENENINFAIKEFIDFTFVRYCMSKASIISKHYNKPLPVVECILRLQWDSIE
jgi:hypothetical protein